MLNILKKRWLTIVPFVFFACLILLGTLHFGVNTPSWDDWEMVTIFQKADNHTLSFKDLWAQHNEHRIFFPNIIILSCAYLTHWNIKAQLLLSFSFSLITALMLYLFILDRVKNNILALGASVLIAAWTFSPVQYENWLWGWQLEWFLCVAATLSSIFFLDKFCSAKKPKTPIFVAAILSSIVATFSLGGGMLVWLIGFGILFAYRRPRKVVGTWSMAFLASIFAYYFHYYKPPNSPSQTLFIHEPVNFLRLILNYVGRPVTNDATTSILVGGILLSVLLPLLFLVWLKRAHIQKYVPWLGFIFFTLGAGTVTAISRLGPDVGIKPVASRYTAFSVLYIIGLTGLVFSLLDTYKINNKYSGFAVLTLFSLSMPLLFSSYQNGKVGLEYYSGYFKQTSYCTHLKNPSAACLHTTYPWDTRVTQKRLDYLKERHWAGY